MPVPSEGEAAKPGAQRCWAFSAFVLHLQPPQGARRRGDRGPMLVKDGMHAGARCMRQRLRAGEWHHAGQWPPPMDVKGPQGVWPHAPICRVVWRHDAVGRRLETCGHGGRCAAPHGARALRADHLAGHREPAGTVEAAPVVRTAVLVIRLLGDDCRAAPAGGGRARVGEQGLLLCEGQLERLAQERLALVFARFGCLAWTTPAKQPSVGIPHLP
jgi:hypothetical protein